MAARKVTVRKETHPQASRHGAGKKTARKSKGTMSLKMPFRSGGQETSFTRADLVFTGVNHSGTSYEVRAFLNNLVADCETARGPEAGYAGRFVVFGHGNCFGDVGHCDVPSTVGGVGRHLQHPITPQKKIVTITKPLLAILETDENGLKTVTLVPVSKAPNPTDRGLVPEVLTSLNVSLRTYR